MLKSSTHLKHASQVKRSILSPKLDQLLGTSIVTYPYQILPSAFFYDAHSGIPFLHKDAFSPENPKVIRSTH